VNYQPWLLAAISAAMAAGGAWIFQSAFGRLRLRRSVADTPTSKIRSAAMGKVELKGLAAVLGRALTAPFSGRPCVWVRWLVEEEKTSVDSKGRRHKSWQSIAHGVSGEPFQLDDGTGTLMVLPAGAEVDAPKLFYYSDGAFFKGPLGPSGPLYPQYQGGFLSGRRRFSEWRIDAKRPVYLLGVHRPAREGMPASIGQGRTGEPFLIAAKSEDELISSLAWGVAGRLVGGAALSLGGAALAAHIFLGWSF
jgi:hypothetical protein